MAVALKTDNGLLDLTPDITVSLQESVLEIGNLSEKKGGWTNDFTLPLTTGNIEKLGFITISNLESGVTSPYKFIVCDLLDNDLAVKSGVLQINSIDNFDKSVSVTFFDNNTFLFILIKNKSIRDLDWSDYEHTWSSSDIIDSWDNTDGYVYIPVNYDNQLATQVSNVIDVTFLFPHTFVKTVIKKIIQEAGFTLSGSLLNDSLYNKKCVGYAQEEFKHVLGWKEQREFLAYQTENVSRSLAAVGAEATATFNNDSTGPGKDPGGNYDGIFRFIADVAHTGRIHYQGRYTYQKPATDSATVRIEVHKNGVNIGNINSFFMGSGATNFSRKCSGSVEYSAASGDIFTIVAHVTAGSFTSSHTLTYLAEDISDPSKNQRFFNGADLDMIEDSDVNLSTTLPDISQSDFLNEILFRFQSIPSVDPKSKQVSLDLFNDIKKKVGKDFVNWTEKLDKSKRHGFEFTEVVQDYGKANIIEQQIDDESELIKDFNANLSRPLGFGVINIDNDFLEEEQTLFTSDAYPFTNEDCFVSGGEQLDLPTYNRDDELRFIIYSGKQSVESLSFQTITSMTIAGQAVSEMAWGYFEKRDFGDSAIDSFRQTLSFESNITSSLQGIGFLEQYFPDITRILQEPRMFRGFFRLNNLDQHNFSFLEPVFFDSGEETGYFYVNKFPQNSIGSNDSIEVELVKLI